MAKIKGCATPFKGLEVRLGGFVEGCEGFGGVRLIICDC